MPRVRLRLPDGKMYGEIGEVNAADNRVNPLTGTVKVRAVVANPDRVLGPGLYVDVVIEEREAHSALVVPMTAVLQDRAGHFVMVG